MGDVIPFNAQARERLGTDRMGDDEFTMHEAIVAARERQQSFGKIGLDIMGSIGMRAATFAADMRAEGMVADTAAESAGRRNTQVTPLWYVLEDKDLSGRNMTEMYVETFDPARSFDKEDGIYDTVRRTILVTSPRNRYIQKQRTVLGREIAQKPYIMHGASKKVGITAAGSLVTVTSDFELGLGQKAEVITGQRVAPATIGDIVEVSYDTDPVDVIDQFTEKMVVAADHYARKTMDTGPVIDASIYEPKQAGGSVLAKLRKRAA